MLTPKSGHSALCCSGPSPNGTVKKAHSALRLRRILRRLCGVLPVAAVDLPATAFARTRACSLCGVRRVRQAVRSRSCVVKGVSMSSLAGK